MWLVEITLDIKTDSSNTEFTNLVKAIYQEFLSLDGVVSPTMYGKRTDKIITFAALTPAETRVGAQDAIVSALRTSCHAAGASTASWSREAIDAAFDRSAQTTVSSAGLGNLVHADQDLVLA